MQEIERKFLVKRLPDDAWEKEVKDIDQGYIAVEPNETEVRVRRIGGRAKLTVKCGLGVSRPETEINLSEEQFAALWETTDPRRLKKRRIMYPLRGLLAEIDVFCERHVGLITVEVEFHSIKESELFVPPDWFGADVTNDPRYRNQSLAQAPGPPDPNRPA